MKKFSRKECPELQSLPTEEINGKRYYVTPSGMKVPSVTTVLGYFKKKSIMEWRNRVGHDVANQISNRAATRGTKFHSMMEKYLVNVPVTEILKEAMPDMKQSFQDMAEVLTRLDNIHYIESPLYSETLRIAGRTDCIAEFDGELSIIDFKTSREHKKESWIEDYFIQGTAYALMYEERVGTPIHTITILISPGNGLEPQVFKKNKSQYVDALLNKLEIYHRENQQ